MKSVKAFRNISSEAFTVAPPFPAAEDPPLLDPPPQALINIEDMTNAVHTKNLGIVMLIYREESKRGAMLLELGATSYPDLRKLNNAFTLPMVVEHQVECASAR